MARENIVVSAADGGERLDRFLRRVLPGPSRAARVDLLEQGKVRVNGRLASKGLILQPGDEVQLDDEARRQGPAADHELELRLLYEDAWLVAVDKPAGVPSHALRAGETGNIASALLARYPQMQGVGHRELEPGLLHRLDTDTSGVLLAARSQAAFEALHALHASGHVDKVYVALCTGQLQAPQHALAYLDASTRRVRVSLDASSGGREIVTRIASVEPMADFSLVSVHAAFAARHQVRAHLAALGHPIVGDAVYGGADLTGLDRHFLHARSVAFVHPYLNERVEIHAPLPDDLTNVLAGLRRD